MENLTSNRGNSATYSSQVDSTAGHQTKARPDPKTGTSHTGTSHNDKDAQLTAMRETEYYRYLMPANDINDFKRRVLMLVNNLGFSDFLFTHLDTSYELHGKVTSLPADLLDTYYSESFYRHDLLWKYLEQNDAPIFQSVLNTYVRAAPIKISQITSNQALADLTESYGYADYYILPAKSQLGGRSALAIHSAKVSPRAFQDRVATCQPNLELLCCAVDYICAIRFAQAVTKLGRNTAIGLSARPVELLKHLAVNDCTLGQAAQRMGITVKTAAVHINTVRKAFGVSTSPAAVLQAIKHRFIDPHERE